MVLWARSFGTDCIDNFLAISSERRSSVWESKNCAVLRKICRACHLRIVLTVPQKGKKQ